MSTGSSHEPLDQPFGALLVDTGYGHGKRGGQHETSCFILAEVDPGDDVDVVVGKAVAGIPAHMKECILKTGCVPAGEELFGIGRIASSVELLGRVVVFDEAQRAWNRDQAAKFMHSKRGHSNFNMSEPEFLVGVMDRHKDWCVVVCLIGGGQEINTGEAGLIGWSNALKERFTDWDVYFSKRLSDPDYASDLGAVKMLKSLHATERNELHLAVSMRSFRAEALSSFVGHVVENRPAEAWGVYKDISDRYPIRLTRDLDQVRRWLRYQARGSERYGLLASSGAYRLRGEGLHVRAKIDAPTWFLNDRTDVRSSFYCEEVGTEFDVQGLELDWTGVCWDADFRHWNGTWNSLSFRGTRWQHVNTPEGRLYLKNAYIAVDSDPIPAQKHES